MESRDKGRREIESLSVVLFLMALISLHNNMCEKDAGP